MKKTTVSLIGLFLFALINLNAQPSIGPKLGLNLATMIGEDFENSKIKIGPQIGCLFEIGTGNVLTFQPGFVFSNKGATLEGEEGDASLNFWYLEWPLNGVVNLDVGKGKIQIFAGPYIGFCIAAKMKYPTDEGEETVHLVVESMDDLGEGDIRLMDYGLNAGLGYRIHDVQIQAGYGLSIGNVSRYDDSVMKHGVVNLTFAYLFKLRK